MKANEFMIGDWVRVRLPWRCPVDGHIEERWYTRQVTGIRTNGTDADKFYLDFRPWGVLPRDIEPIPLTPEILEKNGFEKKSERFRHYEYEFVLNPNTEDERYLIVRLHPKNENYDLMWAYIYYLPTSIIDINTIETKIVNCCVHEFQHALRLCGIDKDIELLEL